MLPSHGPISTLNSSWGITLLWPNKNFASIEFPAGELKNQPLFEIFSNVVKSVIACVAIASIFAGSLGIPFDIDKSWDEKRQQWSISGKIYKSQNITMTAKGDKSGKWTTVFSAACLIL